MAINTYLSIIESNKLRKQGEQRQNHGYREHFDGCQMGGRYGGMDEEVRGLRSTNRWLQKSRGDVRYSIGNGAAKELTRMTHGHEPWCGDCLKEWGLLSGGEQRGKNQDNCNRIIKI